MYKSVKVKEEIIRPLLQLLDNARDLSNKFKGSILIAQTISKEPTGIE